MENKESFYELLDLIKKKLDINCRQYNEHYIKRRINSRIIANELNQNDYSAYIKLIENKSEEIRDLFNALTVNVTRFFRDKTLWNFIRSNVFPKLLSEKKLKNENSLLVWSCGCSSGEEPFSYAILLKDLNKGVEIKPLIIATDIDEPSLAAAKNGVYEYSTLTDAPADLVEKYFIKTPDNRYKVDDTVKKIVTFKKHNFFNEKTPATNFDLISCRNVIIYFTPESKGKLVNVFYDSLADHGWLILGESEILFTNHLKNKFYLYNEKERIYRKERRKIQVKVDTERRKNWWYGY